MQVRNDQSLTTFKRSDVVTDHVYINYLHSDLWVKKQAVKLVLYVIILNYCTRVLEKTLETPLDCKEIKAVNPKGSPEYSLEGLLLKLKLQYFGHLMQKTNSLEWILILGKIEGKRRRGVAEDEMVR